MNIIYLALDIQRVFDIWVEQMYTNSFIYHSILVNIDNTDRFMHINEVNAVKVLIYRVKVLVYNERSTWKFIRAFSNDKHALNYTSILFIWTSRLPVAISI